MRRKFPVTWWSNYRTDKTCKSRTWCQSQCLSKARQVMEVLSHGSHLTKPSRYQNDRERLKICWYLLWCLENGWPYNRTMKSIAPKDGKWVAAILWAEHVKLYHEEFDRRKVEWEQNPNAQNLNSLNMVEMDYIWRVIDSDEQQKFIFWSSFKSMLENGYKNDGYKKETISMQQKTNRDLSMNLIECMKDSKMTRLEKISLKVLWEECGMQHDWSKMADSRLIISTNDRDCCLGVCFLDGHCLEEMILVRLIIFGN